MDVRPAPVAPVGGGARSRNRLSLLAPLVALVVVVGAAWAGSSAPRTAPPELGGDLPSQAAVEPGLSGLPGLPGPSTAPFGLPATAFGLPVRSGAEVVAARNAGQLGRRLVAVGGLLRNDALPLVCPAIRYSLSRVFCRRLLAIFPTAGPDAPAGLTSTPGSISAPTPTFLAQVLPGTPFPTILAAEGGLPLPASAAVQVIVIGHYGDRRLPGCSVRDSCSDDFVVERVAWLAGEWVDTELVRDPAITQSDAPGDDERFHSIARRAIERGEQILGLALVGARMLTVVDPPAAAAVGANPTGGLWYVRSMVRQRPGDEAIVVWTVMDNATGLVLATR